MTAMITEIESVELEDFEFDVLCQPWRRECDRKAEWMLVKPCCGASFLYCAPHKEQAVKEVDKLCQAKQNVFCFMCRYDGPAHKWVDYRWVKL